MVTVDSYKPLFKQLYHPTIETVLRDMKNFKPEGHWLEEETKVETIDNVIRVAKYLHNWDQIEYTSHDVEDEEDDESEDLDFDTPRVINININLREDDVQSSIPRPAEYDVSEEFLEEELEKFRGWIDAKVWRKDVLKSDVKDYGEDGFCFFIEMNNLSHVQGVDHAT